MPDAADDASSNAVAPTDAAAADAEAVERAAVADDAADAAAASASATAEVADEAQQAVVAVEQSADGVVSILTCGATVASPLLRMHLIGCDLFAPYLAHDLCFASQSVSMTRA